MSNKQKWQSSLEPKPTRVLVVDDDMGVLSFLSSRLRMKGYEVAARCAGHDHLVELSQLKGILAETKPDVVVTDYDMLVFDGHELAREVKKINPNLPVILHSGNAEATLLERTQKNFAAVVDKQAPLNIDGVAAAIQTICEGQGRKL